MSASSTTNEKGVPAEESTELNVRNSVGGHCQTRFSRGIGHGHGILKDSRRLTSHQKVIDRQRVGGDSISFAVVALIGISVRSFRSLIGSVGLGYPSLERSWWAVLGGLSPIMTDFGARSSNALLRC